MTVPESVLLERAADHLDALDRNATDSPWKAGRTVLNDTGIHKTSGNEDEIAVAYDETDAALIVALRPMAAELAVFFRHQSQVIQPDGFAVRWARAVLGETEGETRG